MYMKYLFLLALFLVSSMAVSPAFAQSISSTSITVAADKDTYETGDIILIRGTVQYLLTGTPVGIRVIAPNNNIVFIDQLTVGVDKKFSTEFIASGVGTMKFPGTYTIEVMHGTKSRSTETHFGFNMNELITETKPIVSSRPVAVTDITIEEYVMDHTIINGNVLSMKPNLDNKSLIILIESVGDNAGTLIVNVPRAVLDAEDEFIVLVDSGFANFEEVESTPESRTLVINFPNKADKIEIIGTFVIPEFGTIALVILSIGIISMIVLTKKSPLIPNIQ